MAKKEKSIKQQRKSFKIRGIVYSIIVILLTIATVLLTADRFEQKVETMLYPKSRILSIEGEKKEVFAELSKEEMETEDGSKIKVDVAAYYYLDENGEKQYISPELKPTGNITVRKGFQSDAKTNRIFLLIPIVFFLAVFCVVLLVYLLRFSYFISNKDEELKAKIGDRMNGLRAKRDKLSTKLSKKISKKK